MPRWIHKGCGGEIEVVITMTPLGMIKTARCKKCGKEWDVAAGIFGAFLVTCPRMPQDWEVVEV